MSNKIVLVENGDVLNNDQEITERVLVLQDNMLTNIDNDEDFDNIIMKIY